MKIIFEVLGMLLRGCETTDEDESVDTLVGDLLELHLHNVEDLICKHERQ